MVPSNDGTLEPSTILFESESEVDMALGQAVAELMTQQLTQTGIIAQNNMVTVQKIVDYDYLENKRMVTLDEAIGVREVSAQSSPGGPSRV